jgi:hypothetical protein
MSLFHHEHPFSMNVNGEEFGVGYWPGDSKSGMVRIPPWLYSTRGVILIRCSLAETPTGEDLFGSLSTSS